MEAQAVYMEDTSVINVIFYMWLRLHCSKLMPVTMLSASPRRRSLSAPLAALRLRLLLGHRQHCAVAELRVSAAGCLDHALSLDEHHQVSYLRHKLARLLFAWA